MVCHIPGMARNGPAPCYLCGKEILLFDVLICHMIYLSPIQTTWFSYIWHITLTNNFPYYFDAYDSLLTVYIQLKKSEKAIEILDIFVNDFEVDESTIEETVKDISSKPFVERGY